MNKALYFATFAIGAVIGSVAAWQFSKKKYEQLIQEEIDSVKQAFKQSNSMLAEEEKMTEEKMTEENTNDHIVKSSIASSSSDNEVKIAYLNKVREYHPEETKIDAIYLISPDEFGEDENYKIVGLSLFSDGVLADDHGDIMDVNSTVGKDALNHFGDYEDNAVFVRNDDIKTDFEVLLEARKYSEVYPRRND